MPYKIKRLRADMSPEDLEKIRKEDREYKARKYREDPKHRAKMLEKGKRQYWDNLTEEKARMAKYRARPEIREKARAYAEVWRETEFGRAYRKAHRHLEKPRMKEYRKEPRGIYREYKQGAKARDHVFALPFDYFAGLLLQECVYCGEPKSNGVDRQDNKDGYTIENSKPCCNRCNMSKRALSVDEFVGHCKKVAEFNSKK